MTRLQACYIEEALRFVLTNKEAREELQKEIGEYGISVLEYARPQFAVEHGILMTPKING